MLPDHKNFGGKVHWQILDEQDEILIADPAYNEKKSGYSASSINLGVWNLNLQVEQGSWLREAFTSNQGIYFVGFIFVILGLIVGLIFTLRGLAQEGKLTRLKSNFISSVTHELKSPVTSIRQMSELLDRDRIQSEERKKEYYSTMLAQSERLSHLVENILDFSRLEYGPKKLRLEETEIDKLIEETIEIFKIRLRYTGFKIKVKFKQNLPQLRIDREGIQQVVYNLLDNAYKYSGSSREIEIEIMKSNTEVGISIIDCGIGIHPNDQKKIFNRYYRSTEEVNNDIKGNGIGLAIVSQIVDAHNGRLELKSQPGMGSTFTVFIPVTEEP